jgi:hypothetical protein
VYVPDQAPQPLKEYRRISKDIILNQQANIARSLQQCEYNILKVTLTE